MVTAKPAINVQDGFFYQLRKDNALVEITLLTETKRIGRIRRFDKYAVVVEIDGREEMLYKHAIASVVPLQPLTPPGAPPRTPGFER
jgi:host factor-I protein